MTESRQREVTREQSERDEGKQSERGEGEKSERGEGDQSERGKGEQSERGDGELSTLDALLATTYSRSQMYLSRQLAQLHPELTMPMFSGTFVFAYL